MSFKFFCCFFNIMKYACSFARLGVDIQNEYGLCVESHINNATPSFPKKDDILGF